MKDQERFGAATAQTLELVESSCAMHHGFSIQWTNLFMNFVSCSARMVHLSMEVVCVLFLTF